MFLPACRLDDLRDSRFEVAAVDRTLVLVVWPEGGAPRAFQGFCPHKREPLGEATFTGSTLVCPYHDWVFDAADGRCTDGKPCRLAEYPLRVEGNDVLVETDGVEPNYL